MDRYNFVVKEYHLILIVIYVYIYMDCGAIVVIDVCVYMDCGTRVEKSRLGLVPRDVVELRINSYQ